MDGIGFKFKWILSFIGFILIHFSLATYEQNPANYQAGDQAYPIYADYPIQCGSVFHSMTSEEYVRKIYLINFVDAPSTVSFSVCHNGTKFDAGISFWAYNPRLNHSHDMDAWRLLESDGDSCMWDEGMDWERGRLIDVDLDYWVNENWCYAIQIGGHEYLDYGNFTLTMTCDEVGPGYETACNHSFMGNSSYNSPPGYADAEFGEALFQGALGCDESVTGMTTMENQRHFWRVNWNESVADFREWMVWHTCSENTDSDFDTGLTLWRKHIDGSGMYNWVEESDQYCWDQSKLNYQVNSFSNNWIYYLQLGGYGQSSFGSYELTVNCLESSSQQSTEYMDPDEPFRVSPDRISDAFGEAVDMGNLACESTVTGMFDFMSDNVTRHFYHVSFIDAGFDIVYSELQTCDDSNTQTTMDTGISLWRLNENGRYKEWGFKDDGCGYNDLHSRMGFYVDQVHLEHEWVVEISGAKNDEFGSGDYALTFHCHEIWYDDSYSAPPDDDQWGMATYAGEVACGDTVTNVTGESTRYYYKFVGGFESDEHDRFVFDMCDDDLNSYDTGVSLWIYDGEDNEYQLLDFDKDGCPVRGQLSRLELEREEFTAHGSDDEGDGSGLYVLVAGEDGEYGEYSMNIECYEFVLPVESTESPLNGSWKISLQINFWTILLTLSFLSLF